MKEKDSIFHYCSVETFIAIIRNKTIRLSDLNKTNDFMEKKWALGLIAESLKEVLKELEIEIGLETDFWYDETSKSHLQYFLNTMREFLYEERPILIACFSKDNDLLSQWRSYGKDGAGVAIGFNYNTIKTLNKAKNISVSEIAYKQAQQKRRLKVLIKKAINTMHNEFIELGTLYKDFNTYFEEEFDGFCEELYFDLGVIGCTIKNPAFSEESEVRIIYDYLPPLEIIGDISDGPSQYFDDVFETGHYKIGPIKFTNKNEQLVACCDIDFSQLINENIINQIVIGPKSKLTKDDVFYFLLSEGYNAFDINVHGSNASYR